MQSRRSAAMDAGHQVAEGNALALVAVATAAAAGAGAGGTPKEPAGLPCPRCESRDTKFCYYNNYNLGQPRHFCKGCRRYWTRGGALRNVPVGGGTRKPSPSTVRRKQRAAASTSPPAPLSVSAPAYATVPRPYDLPLPPFMPPALAASPPMDHDRRTLLGHDGRMLMGHDRRMLVDPDRRLLDLGGSFTSLLAPAPDGTGRFSSTGFLLGGELQQPAMPSAPALPPPASQAALPEGMIWAMGWPDLSI